MKVFAKQLGLKSMQAAALMAVLTACGQQSHEQSSISVTNGREIKEKDFPSVVLLVANLSEGQAICTGTFVNSSQVVTAGHCVEGLSSSKPEMYYATQTSSGKMAAVARAISFVRNPNYTISLGVENSDLSVVTFPEGTAPATSNVATVNPKAGDKLTIVGYGNNETHPVGDSGIEGTGAGVKRVGSNEIGEVADGMITFVGIPEKSSNEAPLGEYVLSGSGDSGGPLFVNGKLTGVTSGGGFAQLKSGEDVAVSRYVDLTSAESRAFLLKNLKR